MHAGESDDSPAQLFTPQPLAARGIVMIMTGGRAGGAGGRADQTLSGA